MTDCRFSLTEPAIQLVPIMAHLWYVGTSPPTGLRERHLGIPGPAGTESGLANHQTRYEAGIEARPAPRALRGH